MNIMIIGSKGAGKGAHFSEGLAKAYFQMGFKVHFYDPLDFCTESERIYRQPIPLSTFERYCDDKCDFIFIDQCNFQFKNDVDTLVFYNHKFLHRHPTVYHPDVMFHACEPFKDYFMRQGHQWYCHEIKRHEILHPAVDPEIYKPAEKNIKGIVGIGFRRSFDSWIKAAGITMGATTRIIEQEVNEFKKIGKFFDTSITDDEYRDILSRAKVTWCLISPHQYITRRMLEAMACKTVCFIKLESEEHENVLKNMGYCRGRDYIGVYRINEDWNYVLKHYFPDLKTLNAYEITLEKHTYKSRVEQILNTYHEVKE